jgi:hypothetical protein
MESTSEAGRVHCSTAFAGHLREQCPQAALESRGVSNIKGKGWVTGHGVGAVELGCVAGRWKTAAEQRAVWPPFSVLPFRVLR